MRYGPVFAALAVLATPASAASFDCAKATTPLETAICTNPDLSRADEDMARAFSVARKALSETASAKVLDNQRHWNDFVASACTDNAQPKTTGRYDEDGVACLTTLFTNRTKALAEIGPRDGLVFYPVDLFSVSRDPDRDSWSKVATTRISYVQIDGNDKLARAFNAYSRTLARTAGPSLDQASEGTADYEFSISISNVSGAALSVSVDEYFYAHGAAHGGYSITYGTFLRDLRRPLRFDDVFAGTGWVNDLAPLVERTLESQLEEDTGQTDVLWPDRIDVIRKAVVDPSRWDVQSVGIAFQFQPYEVTAYAFGAPKALIRWNNITPWFRPGADRLLTGVSLKPGG